MQSVFRKLVPAPPSRSLEPGGSEPRKRKKKKARLACNHCRLKRTRCDGARPECTRCQRVRMPCVYLSDDAEATPTMALKSEVESLQRRLQGYTELLENLRNAPEDEVLNIVRQLRSTDNVSALLSLYQRRVGDPSQTSEHASLRAVLPSTESDIEFELGMLHPTAYPVLVPPSPSLTASANLIGGSIQNTSSSSTPLSSAEPYTYCDPRLKYLTVRYWTQIQIDDGLAAQALSQLLLTDHPVLGFFDAGLFLRDLVSQGLSFCSSFLFHSVMSLACQLYSTIDSRIMPFSTSFIEEALNLWYTERLTDSTTTLAALNFLLVATGWNGRNELINHQLVADACAMTTRMQMLDIPLMDTSIGYSQNLNEDEMRDKLHVA